MSDGALVVSGAMSTAAAAVGRPTFIFCRRAEAVYTRSSAILPTGTAMLRP